MVERVFGERVRDLVRLIAVILMGSQVLSAWAADGLRPLTPRDELETARFVSIREFRGHDRDGHERQGFEGVFSSPDRSRALFGVVRGDAARDGVWLELWVSDPSSLTAASRPTRLAR
jgi:hypothetical protein